MIHVKYFQRRGLFVFLDFIGVFLTFFLALYIRSSIGLPFFKGMVSVTSLFPWKILLDHLFILALFYVAIQYLWGKYDLWASESVLVWAKRLTLPNLFLLALIFSYLYLLQRFDFPRSFVVTFCALNFLYGLVCRLIYFRHTEKEILQIVLIGSLKALLPLAKAFGFPPFTNRVKIAGIFTKTKSSHLPERYQMEAEQYPVYPLAEFKQFSREHFYHSVIIDSSEFNPVAIMKDLLREANTKASLYVFPSAYEILLGRLDHVQVNDLPLLELKLKPISRAFVLFKRLFDIVFAIIVSAVLFIPSLLIALTVKFTSKGSVFYTQQRVGLNGKVFKIYKFRSMVMNAERETGAVLATKQDRRITGFGKFLRKTRLDEIPQLLNIIKGDMSFVGPRPERPYFVKKFQREIPGYSERKRIRPGITGLAQVSGNYESTPEIKLKYDLAYLVNQSLLLDLQIMLRTLKTILTKAGQ